MPAIPSLSGLIIRKLLHPDNVLRVSHTFIHYFYMLCTYLYCPLFALQLRQDGLRLLTLWLQALQNNAGDASMQLFASAVPHFPPQKTPLGLPSFSSPSSSSSSSSLHPHLSTHSLVERYGTYSSRDGAGLLSRRASSASVSGYRGMCGSGGREKKRGEITLLVLLLSGPCVN